MDLLLLLKAMLMGLVEGLTEFLPVSSTGHLILAGSLLGFHQEKHKVFEIVIQSGAILAVCWEYRVKLVSVFAGITHDHAARRFLANLFAAFIPLALLGWLFGKEIKTYLFNAQVVATTFIVGGLIILWVERRSRAVRVDNLDKMTLLDALKVGFAQAFALIPGTSRAGATIIGGMLFGLSRKAATEFSFFLAIPTLLVASAYQLYKERALFVAEDFGLFAAGMSAAFISAFIAVRALLRYISTHDFKIFAWYRIIFGLLVLLTAHLGWVNWSIL